jgi:uncharacterized protein
MPKTKHRIVIDTNLWISFLLTKNLSKLDTIFTEKRVAILFSQASLDEFVEVANRPKFKKYFTTSDLHELLLKISKKSKFINVISEIDVCRDKKDNFLLSLAVDGQATHLLTGDKDLLSLEIIQKTKIMTISDYIHSI